MKILGISGSLRQASTNTRLLAAATQLVPGGVTMEVTSCIGTLPLFTPDLDPSAGGVVEQWADEVRTADGIVVSTPEYAGGYPGALKNALDWLVGTDAFINKPFMLLNASPRSILAQDGIVRVLETMSGCHVEGASATIPLLGTKATVPDIIANRGFAEAIQASLALFVSEVRRLAGDPRAEAG